jgi:hypothetical protein
MVKVFGVERNKCEHKSCKNKATGIIISGINTGCNTWVYCPRHFKIHKEMVE